MHQLWIFDVCGHSVPSIQPVRRCAERICSEGAPSARMRRKLRGKQVASPSVTHNDPLRREEQEPVEHKEMSRQEQEAPESTPQVPIPTLRLESNHPTTPKEREPLLSPCPRPTFHPYCSYRISTLCPSCTETRNHLLSAVESANELRFEDWRWKVKYLFPVPENSRFDDPLAGNQNQQNRESSSGTLNLPIGE